VEEHIACGSAEVFQRCLYMMPTTRLARRERGTAPRAGAFDQQRPQRVETLVCESTRGELVRRRRGQVTFRRHDYNGDARAARLQVAIAITHLLPDFRA